VSKVYKAPRPGPYHYWIGFETADDATEAISAWKWRSAYQDMDNWLRALQKYEDIDTVKVDEARAKLRELVDALGLVWD